MSLIVLLAAAVAPVIAIILFIYFKDKYEKEPFLLLVKCFFLGALSVVPALAMELFYSFLTENVLLFASGVAAKAFIGIALCEEFSKYFFLRYYAFPKKDFNEPFDGIVYAVMISMGFATVENIMYVVQGGWQIALLRAFTAVPAHATFAVLMGFYVGLAKFKKQRQMYLAIGLTAATVFHGMYDYFLMQEEYPALSILAVFTLVLAVKISLRAIRINRSVSPFKAGNDNEIDINF